MPFAEIDGISTRYEVTGEGPPLLMFSPGGFDARIEKWTDLGVYKRIRLLDHLPRHFTCILFDRRENGQSGGRVERVTWDHYVRQGAGLLDHLGHDRAHLMGGCMGCCPVSAFAATLPHRVISMVHYWPVGGANYRISGHQRFARHLAFAEENGLQAVVDLVKSHDKNFSGDPRGGPWGQPIRNSDSFAAEYAALDLERYLLTVRGMMRGLIDRDTSPGAEPEDLMRLSIPALVVPGADGFHATSAARYMHECLSGAEYWDVPPDAQTEETAPARVLDFLRAAG
ncbi:Dihydrolipoyllysine-residue acetyltransferase component of acetoin cleaving system [Roseivivax jejudonensis]|uniref:Dihydrolipoyllysine-residue acetyltransferase component of acetoin cleaving system n=1 Tax=Roseivivax jejudonensis TaxID=1529041 RepID=A0A1X6ZX30_9RHOB|nr:alpha/beta hydrolase [Roseivivax jejudonensis]SLN64257.1 Dihydrolipoyllysine-residue acetyltransferase component of acetoin cleaving system [Roseivivax jejudonensis]